MKNNLWFDLGPIKELKKHRLQHIIAGKIPIALIFKNGEFSATSGECNHEKGPLGKGHMEGDYIVCPWHGWQYDVTSGKLVMNQAIGVKTYSMEVRGDDLWVDAG